MMGDSASVSQRPAGPDPTPDPEPTAVYHGCFVGGGPWSGGSGMGFGEGGRRARKPGGQRPGDLDRPAGRVPWPGSPRCGGSGEVARAGGRYGLRSGPERNGGQPDRAPRFPASPAVDGRQRSEGRRVDRFRSRWLRWLPSPGSAGAAPGPAGTIPPGGRGARWAGGPVDAGAPRRRRSAGIGSSGGRTARTGSPGPAGSENSHRKGAPRAVRTPARGSGSEVGRVPPGTNGASSPSEEGRS